MSEQPALIPEEERALIRPLTGSAADWEPWQRAVYRQLRRNAPRFDGRPDMVGTRGMAYLAALRDALTAADRGTYPQVVVGLRVRTVRSLMAAGQKTGDLNHLTAANVVRSLCEDVIRTVETTP